MVKQYKKDQVSSLVDKLSLNKNIILTNYSGVSVKDMTELRGQLREKTAEYKVVRNNFFKLALKEQGYESLDEHLKGPVAVAFMSEQVGEVAKVLKDFGKENKSFSYSVGILDDVLYTNDQIKKIAELPSKDVITAQTMSLINGPATGIAGGMNQIISSLARGINAVAEAQGN